MEYTIFKRPLFINHQAYSIIPELYSIEYLKQLDFDKTTEYSFKTVTNGRIEGKLLKFGDEWLLHLDLYTEVGSCQLGEWFIKGTITSADDLTFNFKNNLLTISIAGGATPDENAVLWEDGQSVLWEDNTGMLWG